MYQPSAALGVFVLVTTLSAQTDQKAGSARSPGAVDQPAAFSGLKYRFPGPFDGGRVSRVTGVAGDPATYYFTSAAGGVWKSTDAGVRWSPLTDKEPIGSTGSIAVAPSDPNVVYVGAGEANIRGDVSPGNGIFKSTDGGKTWTQVWRQEGQIGTLVVHPTNPDVAWAAVLGHAFGPNPERGVYRTKDGGRTWHQVLKQNDSTGASDVALDPTNPNVVFAGFWEARRLPWDLKSGGPGSGLFVSRDGGDSWKRLTESGLPGGIWGKVGVRVAPSDGRRVYALIEADSGGLFRSDDGGESWTRISRSRLVRQRPWYYSTLSVNPKNPEEVWFPSVAMVKTIDGGRTLSIVKGVPHGDNHDVWIDPTNPKRMIVGNDGGVALSYDGGESWFAPRLPLGQCYHVSADNRVPYRIACAQQDLGTAQGPSNSLTAGGIGASQWYDVGGGEAGHVVSKADDPNIVFAGEYFGIITRYDYRTGESRNVSAYPENPSGHGDADAKYRFQWTAPIAPSPFDPNVIYHGANVIFKTTDGGQSWAPISPDLTRNDRTKQQWTGGPITGDNTGVEFYGTVFAIAESPKEPGLIWSGSDDGLVQLTRDGGRTWKNVTGAMAGFPEWATVSAIEPSPFDPATAYVVVDNHRQDDMRPYLYRTTDYGASWKRLDAGLAPDAPLHAVREDPARRGLLYLGTERGVQYSPDGGTTWRPLKLNLPTVPVHDLIVKDADLVLATHGRGMWILDDLTPVRDWADSIAAKPLHAFVPRPATAWIRRSGSGDRPAGENPPVGATITYYLKAKPKGELVLEIADAAGTVQRRWSSIAKPKDGHSEYESEPEPELETGAGLHRVSWDLTAEGAKRIKNGMIDSGDPATGSVVEPGTYLATFGVDGQLASVPVVVKADPRNPVSATDRKAQIAFAAELRDALDRLVATVEQIRSLRAQLSARIDQLKSDRAAGELVSQSAALVGRLDSLEAKIHNPRAEVTYDILAFKGGAKLYSRLAPLYNWAIEGNGAPTQGMREVSADQRKELDGYVGELRTLIDRDLAAVNALATKLGVQYVGAPGPKLTP